MALSRSARRAAAFMLPALVGCLLTGCSSSSGGGAPAPAAAATAAVTAAAAPACPEAVLQTHAGLALGTLKSRIWVPYQKKAFAVKDAAVRQARYATAAKASALVAHELAAIAADKTCMGDKQLSSLVFGARVEADGARRAFTDGRVDLEAVGSLNSAMDQIVARARTAGVSVVARTPTAAQLASGAA